MLMQFYKIVIFSPDCREDVFALGEGHPVDS